MQIKKILAVSIPSLYLSAVVPTVEASTFNMYTIEELTIPEAMNAFDAGTLTSTELTQLYLERIDRFDKPINSVPILNPNALTRAAELDQLRADGTILGPLHGIPVLVKDSFNVAGLPTSNGVEILKNLVATEDAFNVKQLKDAGAIILGKTNMSTWAFSYDGISEAYGEVLNPYVPGRTPGGSSSGSGAAIAANFAMFAMGGETGGSIRVPSTHNALVGLKPSAGLISVGGTWPLTPERDVIGPMARTVTDVAYAMDALVASDPDSIWNPFVPDVDATRPSTYTSFLDDNALQGKVLGLPTHYIGKGDPAKGQSFPLDPEVETAFEMAKAVLEAQGATLVEVDIPAHTSWYIDDEPTAYTDGLRDRTLKARSYYYEQIVQGYNDPSITSFVDLLDLLPPDYEFYDYVETVANAIIDGDAAAWEDTPEVATALMAMAMLRTTEYENFMIAQGIDAFVFPTLNYLAPPQTERGADEVYSTYGSLPARFEANNMLVPGIAVPMGYSEKGIPMSLEFMGNFFEEGEIISYAYDYEQATLLRQSPNLPIPESSPLGGLLVIGVGMVGRKVVRIVIAGSKK